MGKQRGGLTSDIGASGLSEFGGRIQDDFLPDWRTTQDKVKRVEQMLKNSPLLGGALRLAVEMSIRQVDWVFVSENGDDDPDLELVRESFANLSHSWGDHIADAVLMPFYGWSMFTLKYERVNGRLLWRKFKMLGHDTVSHWQFDESGGLAGLQQWPLNLNQLLNSNRRSRLPNNQHYQAMIDITTHGNIPNHMHRAALERCQTNTFTHLIPKRNCHRPNSRRFLKR